MFMKTKELYHPLNKEPVASKPSAPRMYLNILNFFPPCGLGKGTYALEQGRLPRATSGLSTAKVTIMDTYRENPASAWKPPTTY